MSRDLQGRKLLAEARGKVCRDARCSAKQEEPETAPGAHRRQGRDQIDTRDRPGEITALAPGGPHHPCAVGQAKVRRLEHLLKLWVPLRAHHELGIDGCNLVVPPGVDKLLDTPERSAHVKAVDPHPQDARLRRGHYAM